MIACCSERKAAASPQWLIINLQMGSYASLDPGEDGWDEQPGPVEDTAFQARNVWAGRTIAW